MHLFDTRKYLCNWPPKMWHRPFEISAYCPIWDTEVKNLGLRDNVFHFRQSNECKLSNHLLRSTVDMPWFISHIGQSYLPLSVSVPRRIKYFDVNNKSFCQRNNCFYKNQYQGFQLGGLNWFGWWIYLHRRMILHRRDGNWLRKSSGKVC